MRRLLQLQGGRTWNVHAPELWRRTIIAVRRLARLARPHRARAKLSYAKVAESQHRSLIHFHTIFHLEGYHPHHPKQTARLVCH